MSPIPRSTSNHVGAGHHVAQQPGYWATYDEGHVYYIEVFRICDGASTEGLINGRRTNQGGQG